MNNSRLMIPSSIIRAAEERGAAIREHYDKNIYLPWHENLQTLKSLTNTIDALVKSLPDKQLIDVIRNLQVSWDGGIEKELSGTWYALCSLSKATGGDYIGDHPIIAPATNARLKGLHELLHHNDCRSLRLAVETRPDLRNIQPPQIGKPSGITALTDRLGSWGDQLRREFGISYAAAAERIIIELNQYSELDELDKAILEELTCRAQHRTSAKGKETRGDYLKKTVNNWKKSCQKVFGTV